MRRPMTVAHRASRLLATRLERRVRSSRHLAAVVRLLRPPRSRRSGNMSISRLRVRHRWNGLSLRITNPRRLAWAERALRRSPQTRESRSTARRPTCRPPGFDC